MNSVASAARQEKALRARYRRIVTLAALALAELWWFELFLPQVGLSRVSSRTRTKRLKRLARGFHDLAAELGGLMVKVGQFLSARLDVLPEAVTKELEGLQDEVAPEPFSAIIEQLERELGMPVGTAFASIEAEPIAAASLGQVYRATLSKGLAIELGYDDVIVKVLRPGIEQIVEVDLKALRKIGSWLARVKLVARRTDAPALVEEFAATTLQEIDYLHEASNLERFTGYFENDPRVSTPSVIWERSARRVLTMNNVAAIKVSDFDSLIAAGLNPNAVAAELAKVSFEQFFIHGFFHADPHPGNIFVKPMPAESGVDFTLVFIDFGMMGEISPERQVGLQKFLFAVASRDARGWVAACERMGVLLPTADTVILERAITELFDRFGGVGVGDLIQADPREIREFAIRFSEILRTLPFQLPNDYLFLIRAVSLISGVASTLNREFNIWDAVDPFARSLLSGGANGVLKNLSSQALTFATKLAQLPSRVDDLIGRFDRGEVVIRNPELENRMRAIDSSIRRATSGFVFAALLVAGVLSNSQNPSLSYWLFGVSVLPLLHALGFFRINR